MSGKQKYRIRSRCSGYLLRVLIGVRGTRSIRPVIEIITGCQSCAVQMTFDDNFVIVLIDINTCVVTVLVSRIFIGNLLDISI